MAEPTDRRIQGLAIFLQDHGQEIRSRRDPEHIYTAALVGAVGALAWGVATVGAIFPSASIPWWRHPAIVGAIACLVMASFVTLKIIREYRVHLILRKEQVRLASLLADETGVLRPEVPAGLQSTSGVGLGHQLSITIIMVTAVSAGLFCVSIYLLSQNAKSNIGVDQKLSDMNRAASLECRSHR